MLRRELVGQADGGLQVGGEDNAALPGQRRHDDVGPAVGAGASLCPYLCPYHLPGDLGLYRLGQLAGGCEQDGGGQHVVLRLGQQVGGHPGRIGRVVGHDDRLCRPVQPIQPHLAVDLSLGQRGEQSSCSHNLVHAGHGGGAVGQRPDCLCAAQPEEPVHAGDVGRGQGDGGHVAIPASWRGADDDLVHAGHVGRDHGHQQRRGQGGGAARDVDPHSRQRRHSLAQRPAQFGRRPGGNGLAGVEGADALGGQVQRIGQVGGERSIGDFHCLR